MFFYQYVSRITKETLTEGELMIIIVQYILNLKNPQFKKKL
jgi:hypothetical protein